MEELRSKAEWREWAASIPPAQRDESVQVAATVREVIRRDDFRVVLTFLAMPGEIDLGVLSSDSDLILAVTRTPASGPLTIHYLDGPMERHPFGYMQPTAAAPTIDPGAIDVVLVPGLLFDPDGGRLGHGKGYYDRLLSSLHPRPFLIGVTLDRRVVANLPMTATDVAMDSVATESAYREARASGSS